MFINTDPGAGRDFPHITRPALGLAQLLVNWYWVSSTGVKRQGSGVAHLAPTLKKEYSYTSTSLMGLHNLFYGEFYLLSLLSLLQSVTVVQQIILHL
jgi:hypothetical protein